MPMPRNVSVDIAAHVKRLCGIGRQGLATAALLLLCMGARAAFAGPVADWRYCYAGSDQTRRFYISRPFAASGPLDTVERQWIAWLGQQAVRYETIGCPMGPDRAAVEASITSAVRYNATQGRSAVELDWRSNRE